MRKRTIPLINRGMNIDRHVGHILSAETINFITRINLILVERSKSNSLARMLILSVPPSVDDPIVDLAMRLIIST